jgi:hypothetical protein
MIVFSAASHDPKVSTYAYKPYTRKLSINKYIFEYNRPTLEMPLRARTKKVRRRRQRTRRQQRLMSAPASHAILDNGGTPFSVEVYDNYVNVLLTSTNQPALPSIEYSRIFIGDNDLPDPHYSAAKGNSILLHIGSTRGRNQYIYIGHQITAFSLAAGDIIEHYYSPVGNNGVPYPYAVGRTNTYFMLDNAYISNTHIDLSKDGYSQFYAAPRSQKHAYAVRVIVPRQY